MITKHSKLLLSLLMATAIVTQPLFSVRTDAELKAYDENRAATLAKKEEQRLAIKEKRSAAKRSQEEATQASDSEEERELDLEQEILKAAEADGIIKNSAGLNLLRRAVTEKNVLALDLLLALLENKNVINDVLNEEQETALHYATRNMKTGTIIIKKLLEAGAVIDAVDKNGMTALHWAALLGNEACIRQLLDAGIDNRKISVHGKTAWGMANVRLPKEILDLL